MAKKSSSSKNTSKTNTQLDAFSHAQSGSDRLFALNDKDGFFANVVPSTGQVHIRIWKLDTNALVSEVTSQSILDSGFAVSGSKVSSLDWVSIKGNSVDSSANESKRTKDRLNELKVTYLVIGFTNGSILLYSLLHAVIVGEGKNSIASPVSGFVWNNMGNVGYSSGHDGSVCLWTLQEGRLVFEKKLFSVESGKITKIYLLPNSKKLVACHQEISVWSLESKGTSASLATQLPGHTTEIVSFYLSQCNKFAATCAFNDRFCMVWNLNDGKLHRSIGLEANCCAAEINIAKDALYVVCEDNIMRFASIESGKVTGSFGFVDSSTGKIIPLIYAKLISKENILFIRNSFVNVVFESVPFSSLKMTENTQLSRIDSSSKVRIVSANNDLSTVHSANTESVSVVGTAECEAYEEECPFVSCQVAEEICVGNGIDNDICENNAHLMYNQTENECSSSKNTAFTEDSFESKLSKLSLTRHQRQALRELSKLDKSTASSQSKSLGILLSQAVKSQDKTLLDQILFKTDAEVINATLKRYNSSEVSLLLREFVARFQQNPANAGILLPWIKGLLSTQISNLISSPELTQSILKLQKCIENRLVLMGKLLSLEGKLDLVVEQIETRKKSIEMGTVNDNEDSLLILNGDVNEAVRGEGSSYDEEMKEESQSESISENDSESEDESEEYEESNEFPTDF